MNDFLKNIIPFNKGFINTKAHAKFLLENGYSASRLLVHYKMTPDVLVFVLAKKSMENKN